MEIKADMQKVDNIMVKKIKTRVADTKKKVILDMEINNMLMIK